MTERVGQEPLPPWARNFATMFAVPPAHVDAPAAEIKTGFCSVCYDSSSPTYVGSRDGPAAIRDASLSYAAQAASRGDLALTDMQSEQRYAAFANLEARDFGDLSVYPVSPERQIAATRAEIAQLARACQQIVVLGGEHTITYPSFQGVYDITQARGERLGYIQIDHHFDFGDQSSLHGPIYNGSNARRISEIDGMSLERMGFVGQGDFTKSDQLAFLRQGGAEIMGMHDIRQTGFIAALEHVCDHLSARTDCLYVSIDIDVCSHHVAPGTGHTTVGGIDAVNFVGIASVLRGRPVRAIDIVEVNPSRDPSNAAAHLVARMLYDLLFLRQI